MDEGRAAQGRRFRHERERRRRILQIRGRRPGQPVLDEQALLKALGEHLVSHRDAVPDLVVARTVPVDLPRAGDCTDERERGRAELRAAASGFRAP